MAAFKAEEAAQKQAAEEQRKGQVQKVAALESQIADANNAMDLTPCPTRTQPARRALRRTETYIDPKVMTGTGENDPQAGDSDINSITGVVVQPSEVAFQLSETDFDEDASTQMKKRKKDSKTKLRDAVKEARKNIVAGKADEDSDLNLLGGDKEVPRDNGKVRVNVTSGETTTCVVTSHDFKLITNP
jgi:hypothetical protein